MNGTSSSSRKSSKNAYFKRFLELLMLGGYLFALILNSGYTIIGVIDILPLIVGLAVLLGASYEFEFKLSDRIKIKISMEGRMLMVMLLASIKMVAVGVSGVYLAGLI